MISPWRAAFLTATVLGIGACQSPSPHANGTGYGVGIPRVAFTFGNEPQARGFDTVGVEAPTEMDVGRVKRSAATNLPQSGKLHAPERAVEHAR
jgi:hypothetical protein